MGRNGLFIGGFGFEESNTRGKKLEMKLRKLKGI